MSSFSSIVSSSLMLKDPVKNAEVLRHPVKSSDMSKKVQCDLCKLSYSTDKELLDHCLSIMHHTKLEDREENSLHECVLCSVICSNMADYRRHIATDKHQKKLSDLREDGNRKSNWNDNKESVQTSRHSFPSKYNHGGTDFSNYNKQFIRDGNSHGSRVEDPHILINNQFGKDHQGLPHFRYDHVKAGMPSQMWNRGSRRGSYPNNDQFHWIREGSMDQEHYMDIGGKGHPKIQQSYEQSGTEYDDGFYDYLDTGRYSRPRRQENSQESMRINHAYYSQDLRQNLEDSSCMDFTNDVLVSDWDFEKSLLEHEQFLAGSDSSYLTSKHHSHRRSADIYTWEESNVRDRKRPRNEDDVQESLAKSSRSVDSSSNENIPVRDVSIGHSSQFNTPSISKNTPAADLPSNAMPKISTIDDASYNILERAERLCKELREKREASQVQRNLLLKKQDHESLNQRMSTLVQKQQIYLKGHIKDTKKDQDEESYDSGVNSSSSWQLKQNGKISVPSSGKVSVGNTASALQPRTSEKTLDEIKKSMDKSMLKDLEKSTAHFKNSATNSTKRKSLSEENAGLGKSSESKDVTKGIISKLLSKPHLTKDNLKKMVNTPNSRAERLQLIRMLQSREEQKATMLSAPKTSLQLDGLYDSIFASEEVTRDFSQSCDPQTIKLENLPQSVQKKILDLIGGESCSQILSQPETGTKSPSRLMKKTASLADVIVLSDDEDLRNTRKNKKNVARKTSGTSTSVILDYATKTNKKKKTLVEPASKVGLRNSASSLNSPAISKSSHVNQSGNLRPYSPVQHLTKARKNVTLHTDNDVEIVSCSSDLEFGKKKDTFPRKEASLKSSNAALADRQNFSISLTNSKNRNSSRNEVTSPDLSSGHSQLNSTNVREKFPTLLNFTIADRMSSPFKENGTTILSDRDFSDHSSKHYAENASDKISDVQLVSSSIQENLRASSPEVEVRSSLVKTAQGTSSAETSQSWSSSQTATSLGQNSHKIVLPSSTSLINRTSPPHSNENHHIPSSDRSSSLSTLSLMSTMPVLPYSSEYSKVTDSSIVDLHALDNVDHSTADNTRLPDGRINSVASSVIGATSSETMSKLLVLSEKEEYVKQEKMNMDLRLSRLHRLLEQAVVQINKCTERMNQLHEQEQELLKKRLSLLRVATSLKPNQTETAFPSESILHDDSLTAGMGQNSMSNFISSTGARSFSVVPQGSTNSTMSTPAVTPFASSSTEKTENLQGTSLSRTDWLAKFSLYLPLDPVTEGNKMTVAGSIPIATCSAVKEQICQSNASLALGNTLKSPSLSNTLLFSQFIPERDTSSNQIMDVEMKSRELHQRSSVKSGLSDQLSEVASSKAAVASHRGDIVLQTQGHSIVTSTTTSSAASILEPVIPNLITAPIMYVGSFKSSDHSMQLIAPIVQEGSAESMLRKPRTNIPDHLDNGRNLMVTGYQRRESDPLHLSSPSRSHGMARSSEYGEEESDIGSVASSIASGSSLGEQITRYCRATPGASLESKDPFGTHELPVIMSDTSEQRLDSSAEEEDSKSGAFVKKGEKYNSMRPCSISLERLDMNSRKNIYGNLDEKAVKSAEALHLLERHYEGTVFPSDVTSDSGKRRKRKTKQERDTSGFTQRRRHWIVVSSSEEEDNGNSKKEFDFDASPAATQLKINGLSSGNHKSDFSTFQTDANETPFEFSAEAKLDFQSPSKVTGGSDVTVTSKAVGYLDVTVAECDSSTSLGIVDSASNKSSRYPGDFGPVFDILVVRGQMYVGHVNRGVRVYIMSGVNQDKFVKEYYYPYLQCMCIRELDQAVSLILGSGSDLVFCSSKKEGNLRYSLGTTVKCLLLLSPLIYAGLDTGEICIFDTVRMTLRDRCICSDHPIHCLASGQEGALKLLCVSSQDGTIIVVNAQQCLPIRILSGHAKTAFSIQVEGHLVFSGSGDHTVVIHSLHTGAVEHVYRESKGLIKSVCYNQGYLFTGGMDKLVRCYNIKTHQLIQVYYGADRGVISKILIVGDLLITGSISGSVDIVDINIGARHRCHISGCGLNFGNLSHLSWHLLEDHNISS